MKTILLGIIFLLLNAAVCNATNGEESLESDAFATYFGGEGEDLGRAITTDVDGNIIIVGQTTSSAISTLEPTIQEYGGDEDVLIAKFSPDGQLLFFTYYGGTGQDNADGVTTDNEGNIIITGFTTSTNFPTKSALYSTHNGGEYDLFILKLSSDGSEVLFSTFYGGSGDDHNYGHHGSGVTLDSNENIILSATTTSENLPTINAIQANRTGPSDVVILKLSKDGQDLLFATYFGGTEDDFGGNCAVNSQDQICFTGMTDSTDYPIKNGF